VGTLSRSCSKFEGRDGKVPKKVLAVLTPKELSVLSQAAGAKFAAERHYEQMHDDLEQLFYEIEERHSLNHDFAYRFHPITGEVTFKHAEDDIADFMIRLQRKIF